MVFAAVASLSARFPFTNDAAPLYIVATSLFSPSVFAIAVRLSSSVFARSSADGVVPAAVVDVSVFVSSLNDASPLSIWESPL